MFGGYSITLPMTLNHVATTLQDMTATVSGQQNRKESVKSSIKTTNVDTNSTNRTCIGGWVRPKTGDVMVNKHGGHGQLRSSAAEQKAIISTS